MISLTLNDDLWTIGPSHGIDLIVQLFNLEFFVPKFWVSLYLEAHWEMNKH